MIAQHQIRNQNFFMNQCPSMFQFFSPLEQGADSDLEYVCPLKVSHFLLIGESANKRCHGWGNWDGGICALGKKLPITTRWDGNEAITRAFSHDLANQANK